ncbi:MAG: bifunctional precorrin-2 dehydrogenase/sirohydrochlorin ferrochelatase [Sulfurimonadaceae bacterium]|jgi:precorrin-2 dehydrogenase/sirohydrochlorin ferrochelatase|nr:bifunctional precorrin-2 dehydrogenase/sirohydrochlorin ferrochelatase [Sulfurimonadaceae bacterium]
MKQKVSNYPIFLNLKDKKTLIIGGGNVAYVKLNSLVQFGVRVDLVSLSFSPKIMQVIDEYRLDFKSLAYTKELLDGYDLVVACVDDVELQRAIYADSKEFGCLCSCADLPELSDFSFGAIIKDGDVVVAISTSGSSAAFAKGLKNYIKNLLPKAQGEFVSKLKQLRETLPKGRARMEMFRDMVDDFFKNINGDRK